MSEINEGIFKKRWFKNIVILVAIGILSGGGYLLYDIYETNQENELIFDVLPSFGVTRLTDLEINVPADGNIKIDEIIEIELDEGVVIDEVLVFEGQEVVVGQRLILYDTDQIEEDLIQLYDELEATKLSIAGIKNTMDTLYVKAPIDGVLKSVYLESDDMIETAMDENGYVAVVATDNRMVVDIGDAISSYEIDDTIKVTTEGYTYTAVVTLRGDKKVAAFETTARSLGSSAVVYNTDNIELGTGNLDYFEAIYVSALRGEVTRVNASDNTDVVKGDLIYTVTSYSKSLLDFEEKEMDITLQIIEIEALLENPVIVSPLDGIVTMINIDFSKSDLVINIASTESWLLQVDVDELDIGDVELGQSVNVNIDALVDTEIVGEVVEISSIGEASGGITTYSTVIRISDFQDIKVAMTASVEIVTYAKNDVLAVPISAVRYSGGTPYVMVYTQRTSAEIENIKNGIISAKASTNNIDYEAIQAGDLSDDEMAEVFANRVKSTGSIIDQLYGEMREVEVGMSDTSFIEIISGLSLDEKVVLPEMVTSTSDNEEINLAGSVGGVFGGERPPGSGMGTGGVKRP